VVQAEDKAKKSGNKEPPKEEIKEPEPTKPAKKRKRHPKEKRKAEPWECDACTFMNEEKKTKRND